MTSYKPYRDEQKRAAYEAADEQEKARLKMRQLMNDWINTHMPTCAKRDMEFLTKRIQADFYEYECKLQKLKETNNDRCENCQANLKVPPS